MKSILYKSNYFCGLVDKCINPIQDGLFWAAHGLGSQKSPLSVRSITYILQWWNLAVIPHLKKIQEMYKSPDTLLAFYRQQHFSDGNQQLLLYREIQLQIEFWCIISNSFNFVWVFKGRFNKYGYNFDNVSKMGYSRSS